MSLLLWPYIETKIGEKKGIKRPNDDAAVVPTDGSGNCFNSARYEKPYKSLLIKLECTFAAASCI